MSRHRSWEAPEDDALAMSFLDTLSCGIGAAIILFLVFSVVKEEAETPLVSRGNFIRAEFVHREPDALLGVEVRSPSDETLVLWPNDFDEAGRPIAEAMSTFASIGAEVFLVGASVSGRGTQISADGTRVVSLWIREPAEGEWQIGARFVTHRRPGWLRTPGATIEVQGSIQTRWLAERLEIPPVRLAPGDAVFSATFEVSPPQGDR